MQRARRTSKCSCTTGIRFYSNNIALITPTTFARIQVILPSFTKAFGSNFLYLKDDKTIEGVRSVFEYELEVIGFRGFNRGDETDEACVESGGGDNAPLDVFGCIKEYMGKEVGCRLPWEEEPAGYPECQDHKDFENYLDVR